MKRTRTMAMLLLALLGLGLAATACGTAAPDTLDDTPTVPDSTAANGTPQTGPRPTAVVVTSQIGVPVNYTGYTVTIKSATSDGTLLKAAIHIDNSKGDKEVNIAITAFEAISTDNQTMDADIICSDLTAHVDQGKVADGNECWKMNGIPTTKGIKIKYSPGRTAGKDSTWILP